MVKRLSQAVVSRLPRQDVYFRHTGIVLLNKKTRAHGGTNSASSVDIRWRMSS